MEKPTLIIKRKEYYDYHEVIEYIEKKHNINIRDYLNSHNHFSNWLNSMGEEAPNYPKHIGDTRVVYESEKRVVLTKEEYEVRFEVIHDQYKRYKEWSIDNPEPEYLNFWHWIIENDFCELSNGSYQLLNLAYWIGELKEEDWRRSIIELIYNEFKEDEMEFWIEW